jgi:hypothetical protein
MTERPDAAGWAADLLARARALDGAGAAARLQALACVDAARWYAWPHDLPAAEALEAQLLASAATPAPDAPLAALWRADVAARRAPDEQALRALPAGYPLKSLWLRWRALALASGRRDLWNSVRRRLTEQAQQQHLPPSETLPALLGRLDLARWRAEGRVAADVRAALAGCLDPLPRLPGDEVRRGYLAAGGRWLVALGDDVRGARWLYEAAEGVAGGRTRRAPGLFSRPAPEAAIWLRRALDELTTARGGAHDALLHQAIVALLEVAARGRLHHVLVEALGPLRIALDRPDITAVVLLHGALAWHACGDEAQARSWLADGLKLLGRAPRSPLLLEAVRLVGWWVERHADEHSAEAIRRLAPRLSEPSRLLVSIEAARLTGCWGAHPDWQALGAAERQARDRLRDGDAEPLLACAGALFTWGKVGAGLALVRAGLDPGPTAADPATDADAADAQAGLAARCAQPLRADTAAAALGVLLRGGQTSTARLLATRTLADLAADPEPLSRLKAMLHLARRTGEGLDAALGAAVDLAVAEEAARITERLRVDDWPGASAPLSDRIGPHAPILC